MAKTSTAKTTSAEEPEVSEPAVEVEAVVETFEMVRMAAHMRLGSITIRGPVTGTSYSINRFGTGDLVDIRDAEEIAASFVPCKCSNTGEWIQVHPAGILT